MNRILAVFRRDLEHVRGNIIALLVCVGLIVMPSLYAWFNIAGGWDPYANTGQMQVALANSDEGIRGTLIPFHVNVGERVVNALTGSTKVGYVVTSEDEAIEGVSSGKYYAAVVIPKDFSTKLLSVLTKTPTHPQLNYYVNEKRNAIASIVTGKVSGSVQTMIDEGFTEAVSEIATELMDELSGVLDDNLLAVASNLNGALDDTLRALRRSADDIEAYRGVVTSIKSVTLASDAVLGDSAPSLDAATLLGDAAAGIRQFDDAAARAKSGASGAIDAGSNAINDVEAALDEAFNLTNGKVDDIVAALNRALAVARERRADLQSFRDALAGLNGQVLDLAKSLELTVGEKEVDIQSAHTVNVDVSDALSRVDAALAYLDDLIASCEKSLSDIQTAQANSITNKDELRALVTQARSAIESVRTSYDDRLSGSLERLATAIDEAAGDASSASDTLRDEIGRLSPILGDASSGLDKLEKSLDEAKAKLNESAGKVEGLQRKLSGALSSGDMELIRTIFGADSAALVDFFAAPVELKREAVYAIENNGSAMAPYYTTMALWVGGTLMGILFYTALSERALEETGAQRRHAYFGRLCFFLLVGACQSTMLLLGDLFFLKIQCAEPVLFLLTGWLASFVFINIIYSLSYSFGDVGKAIGVLIMVIQVAGSGGTFPVQMLPKVFQGLYSFLPFVYSENAMREAICGVYGNAWLTDMGTLALYLIPALLLGLLLSKPFVPVNEWIEEHLEETKLM